MEDASGSARVVRVGSRKSKLALVQTHHVVDLLKSLYPDVTFEIVAISTTGDKILDVALNKIGEKSLFTKELEVELEKGGVDLVVHSLKDLPTILPQNMVIGAILQREDPRDAVIMKEGLGSSLSDLPPSSVIGTSSVRRRAQLVGKFPHLTFADVRGNLNTRFKKLDEGETYSALILAAAGVKRMGWKERISQLLNAEECIHAVGQGAIAIECREDDEETLNLIFGLVHRPTMITCIAERALMRKLEGGCSAPVAAHAEIQDDNLSILAGVWSLDGSQKKLRTIQVSLSSASTEAVRKPYSSVLIPLKADLELLIQMSIAEKAGVEVAEQLLEEGAGEILHKARLENQAPAQS